MSEEAMRPLDAAVAEFVMGFHRQPVGPDVNGENAGEILVPPGGTGKGYILPGQGKLPLDFMVPRYSSSVTEAWRVVEWLRKKGWRWEFLLHPDGECHVHIGRSENGYMRWVPGASHTDLPRAICYVALRAEGKSWSLDAEEKR